MTPKEIPTYVLHCTVMSVEGILLPLVMRVIFLHVGGSTPIGLLLYNWDKIISDSDSEIRFTCDYSLKHYADSPPSPPPQQKRPAGQSICFVIYDYVTERNQSFPCTCTINATRSNTIAYEVLGYKQTHQSYDRWLRPNSRSSPANPS